MGERLLRLFGRLTKLALDEYPLQDSGLTTPQLSLIDWIASSPGCSIREIADGLDITAPTASVGVRRLEKAGLVERWPDPKDRRSVQLFLSAQGQALHERAFDFRLEKMQHLLAGLTTTEADTLLALLEKAVLTASQARNETKSR
jgi:DNA-binding MarR family transcriptional regulator